jgi:hypothetical protein
MPLKLRQFTGRQVNFQELVSQRHFFYSYLNEAIQFKFFGFAKNCGSRAKNLVFGLKKSLWNNKNIMPQNIEHQPIATQIQNQIAGGRLGFAHFH